jgi:hypothetical protein
VLRVALSSALLLATYALAAGGPSPGPSAVDDAHPIPADSRVGADCTLNGKKLYGKVQVVDHFADFKVQRVDHFPDLNVQFVDHFPDRCGTWQLVDHFPDFTITYVDHFPDLQI